MRFVSQDPIGLDGGLNLYRYVDGNPVSNIDPNGQAVFVLPAIPPILGWIGGVTGLGTGLWLGDIIFSNPPNPDPLDPAGNAGHDTGTRPSTEPRHEEGDARRRLDRGREKGDEQRTLPRRRPDGWQGPWPPRPPDDSCKPE